MSGYLLDANVLIALTVLEHEHHDRCSRWAGTVDQLAVSPISQGALLRYLLRVGESVTSARAVLAGVAAVATLEFWPDSLSYSEVSLDHVRGYRQVTDAYLASLAVTHGAVLATLDEGLVAALPNATLLIPSLLTT